MQRTIQTTVPAEINGIKLIDYLIARFTYHTRDAWSARIAQGHLLLNHAITTPDTLLSTQDLITYCIPDLPEPPVDVAYTTIFEDTDLFVINKPGNLPCHPAGRYFNHTLWALLKHAGYGENTLHLVHRLDRETSGLVVIAKTSSAAMQLSHQFSARSLDKTYLVFVEGTFPQTYTAIGKLENDPTSPVRKKRRFIETSADGKEANSETHFVCRNTQAGISELLAYPKTGHLHQIRATLCSLGYPVVGDKLYGVNDRYFLDFMNGTLSSEAWQHLRLPRQALHAYRLRLRHPTSQAWMEFEAPLPCDMNIMQNTAP